jgi:ABC-type Mn2+/Zn2+ transport system permease subunit
MFAGLFRKAHFILLTAVLFGFGVLSTWFGLLGSYLFRFPNGGTIVLMSPLIFIASPAFSPKRRVKKP